MTGFSRMFKIPKKIALISVTAPNVVPTAMTLYFMTSGVTPFAAPGGKTKVLAP